jgi:hypothetical protein
VNWNSSPRRRYNHHDLKIVDISPVALRDISSKFQDETAGVAILRVYSLRNEKQCRVNLVRSHRRSWPMSTRSEFPDCPSAQPLSRGQESSEEPSSNESIWCRNHWVTKCSLILKLKEKMSFTPFLHPRRLCCVPSAVIAYRILYLVPVPAPTWLLPHQLADIHKDQQDDHQTTSQHEIRHYEHWERTDASNATLGRSIMWHVGLMTEQDG